MVDIVTRLHAERLRDCDSNRGRSKSRLYFPQRHTRFWVSTQSPITLVPGAPFCGRRWGGVRLTSEIQHSLPYNAEVEVYYHSTYMLSSRAVVSTVVISSKFAEIRAAYTL